MNTPRPILKTRPSSLSWNEYFPSPSTALPFRFPTSPHVHFPPTPTLTDTQMTHSPFVYDRAPIVVLPNTCQLPERGGRDYSAHDGIVAAPPSVPSWRMKRAMASYDVNRSLSHEDEDEHPPPLVHDPSDHSSESEDSDAGISSPVHMDDFDTAGLHIHKSRSGAEDAVYEVRVTPPATPRALAFLPHPHDADSEVRPLRRPKPKRRQTGPRGRLPLALVAGKDTFAGAENEMSLNGCLGGF